MIYGHFLFSQYNVFYHIGKSLVRELHKSILMSFKIWWHNHSIQLNTQLRIMANKLKIYLNGFYDRSIRPGMYICPLCKYKSRTCSLIFWANEIIEIEFWVGRKFWEHELGTFKIIKLFFDVFLCTKMISKYLASIRRYEIWLECNCEKS